MDEERIYFLPHAQQTFLYYRLVSVRYRIEIRAKVLLIHINIL